MDLTKIEDDAMVMLLDKPGARYPELKEQFARAVIKKREQTGIGFFLYFDLPPGVPQVMGANQHFVLGLVYAEVVGVSGGVGFLLKVKDGFINYLEGFTFDGVEWPSEISDYKLKYKEKFDNTGYSKISSKIH